MSAPDFVAVGHVTLDRFGDAVRPGGAVLYAALTAARLGLRVGVLTSHGDDFPRDALPPGLAVACVPAGATTVFEHAEPGGARRLRVTAAARPLAAIHVPETWREAALVLLAPVLDEVDTEIAGVFEEATLAAAVQGWLRALDGEGTVTPRPWSLPARVLARAQALFLSTEDASGQETAVSDAFQRVPIGVITAGAHGALLFVNGQRSEIRPRPARVVDPTGAGDVFAAAFLAHYHLEGDPWAAAEAAACAAGLSVEAPGWAAVPDRAALAAALARYRRGDAP